MNNPTIAQAARRVDAQMGKWLQVGLLPNPVIGYEGEEMGEEGAAGQQGMFVGQRFITAGKLGCNRAVRHEVQQARQELEIQRLRVINAIRGRAYETIVAQRAVALNEQLAAIGEEGVKTAQKLQLAKEVGQVDVLQARVEASSAKLALNNARNEYKASWQRLAVVMGVPEMKPRRLADDLDREVSHFSWDDTVRQLLTESPELARAQWGVERAKCGGGPRHRPGERRMSMWQPPFATTMPPKAQRLPSGLASRCKSMTGIREISDEHTLNCPLLNGKFAESNWFFKVGLRKCSRGTPTRIPADERVQDPDPLRRGVVPQSGPARIPAR